MAAVAGIFGKSGICAVVAEPTAAAVVRRLTAILGAGRARGAVGGLRASICEVRLDWLRDEREIARVIRWVGENRAKTSRRMSLIFTCRRREAGGKFRGSVERQSEVLVAVVGAWRGGGGGALVHEEARLKTGPYGRRAAARGVDCWVDLEIESAEKISAARMQDLRRGARVMISYHNFRAAPRDLGAVRRRLERAGGDAIKIAAQAGGLRDALRILASARARRNVVAVPMGEAAAAARILALRAGSALTYAPMGDATAPGQISFEEMTAFYRADRLTRRTRVYAVIGDPVAHSLSPRLHNAAFQARRMEAVYVPVQVRDLRDFLGAIGPLGITGFSVTLPHKEAILRHLDDCEPLAAEIGAVNTVVVRGGGKLYGYNTDYVGVLRAIERRLPLAGSSVLILGAGGSARAVAFALARGGARVHVSARRISRARELARAVGGEAIERWLVRGGYFDAIVNATPVGMWPRLSESPLEARELNCRLVFDLIYRPRVTRLLQLAARRGIETVSGMEMFVAQGTAQFEIWTGERAPVREMMRAVGDRE